MPGGDSDAHDEVIAEATAYQDFVFDFVGDAYVHAANEAEWFGAGNEIPDDELNRYRSALAEGQLIGLEGVFISTAVASEAGGDSQQSPVPNIQSDQIDGDNEADEAVTDGNLQD